MIQNQQLVVWMLSACFKEGVWSNGPLEGFNEEFKDKKGYYQRVFHNLTTNTKSLLCYLLMAYDEL